jgi:putative transposase
MAGARYFVTWTEHGRIGSLATNEAFTTLLAVLADAESDGACKAEALTVMPDHVHLLFVLGDRLSLGRLIARIKTLASNRLESRPRWASEFFDHYVRPDEPLLPILRYLYLNPYSAGLIRCEEPWPFFWMRSELQGQYSSLLPLEGPPPEWLRW